LWSVQKTTPDQINPYKCPKCAASRSEDGAGAPLGVLYQGSLSRIPIDFGYHGFQIGVRIMQKVTVKHVDRRIGQHAFMHSHVLEATVSTLEQAQNIVRPPPA